MSAPVTWEEIDSAEPGDFTLVSMPTRFAHIGDVHAAIDRYVCSLERLLELSATQERDGIGDAPWPPHYRSKPASRRECSRRGDGSRSDRS